MPGLDVAQAKASAALGHGHDIISSHHAELSAAAAALGGASFGNGASHTAFGGIGGAHGSHASAAVDPEASKLVAPGKRLEGLILRSQLLVLLQRRHFCDAQVSQCLQLGLRPAELRLPTCSLNAF